MRTKFVLRAQACRALKVICGATTLKAEDAMSRFIGRQSHHSATSHRYPPTKIKQLPVRVQKRMHEAEDRSGFVPNLMVKYSHRPGEYEAFYDHYDVLMNRGDANLTRAEQEMVALVTSIANNCLYCIIAHSGLHRKYSKKPKLTEQLMANWKSADLSERERAILLLSTAVSNSEAITEAHFENLKEHGLDQEDAWDIAALTAFFNMSTRMVHFVGISPNDDYYTMGHSNK